MLVFLAHARIPDGGLEVWRQFARVVWAPGEPF
jgi:hypothetical protein